ncbi:KRAB-A domain-containing protein 2-like [Palaemon carinicauda]|uniref:KRAB-A domain-containing protein 2-like n=1 Tax=Palaemon carinicauda TaxID=392227 RepID=UPI0035B615BD
MPFWLKHSPKNFHEARERSHPSVMPIWGPSSSLLERLAGVGSIQDTIHRTIGHEGRTSMCKATKEKYANISRDQITLFLQYCKECQLKKSSVRKCVVVKPIVSNSMNSRAQVDLIDMQSQPDGKYCFIFNYQDHLTKMICLRALQTKTAEEGSVERANRDVEAILACWMKDNNTTQWSNGLRFVQWQTNTRFHSVIGRTPYEATYGEKAHLGISAVNIPEKIMEGMETEEQRADALCLGNEEDQNVEKGRSAESCAINCNSCD